MPGDWTLWCLLFTQEKLVLVTNEWDTVGRSFVNIGTTLLSRPDSEQTRWIATNEGAFVDWYKIRCIALWRWPTHATAKNQRTPVDDKYVGQNSAMRIVRRILVTDCLYWIRRSQDACEDIFQTGRFLNTNWRRALLG